MTEKIQPTEVMPGLCYRLKDLVGSAAELDFSWKDDAITICDMRVPSALRYGILYTRADIEDSLGDFKDLSERVHKFMGI